MKEQIQRFGRFLSGMVMPNIGAFIAWGFITALFIDTGWIPNSALNQLVGPMSQYLLPLLIAYTGGQAVGGKRGGVAGAVGAMGVILGSENPMFIGCMLMGPLCGWLIKMFDRAVEGKIKAGFEMLINNFSLGIISGVMACLGLILFTPVVNGLTDALAAGVSFFVDHGILPLASIFIEPAKVLFLNNAINHGILSPMGLAQVEEAGKSIFFLLEANPGPGLGLLLAYCFAGKGSAKSSAPGAVIIHFLGGIHEIYFPYILMNPTLLLSVILGGASGVLVFSLFGAGLVSTASPGSIFAIMAMAPKGGLFPVLSGILVSAGVSFAVSIPLLKIFGKDKDVEVATKKVQSMKQKSKGLTAAAKEGNAFAVDSVSINKIVFACDAGMGSSAMGATVLSKKLKDAGLGHIKVEHSSVSDIPEDARLIVTHKELGENAARANPKAKLVLITNFMAAPEYDEIVQELKDSLPS